MLEMPLHLNIGVKVADPLVKRRRTLKVGEDEGDVEDGNAFRRADHFRAEKVAKGLRHQQSLSGQVRREAKPRALKCRRRKLEDAEYDRQLAGIANFEHDLAGRDVRGGRRALAGIEYDRHVGRHIRAPRDRDETLGVAFEILSQKRAFGGVNLEIGDRAWLYAGERPHQPFRSLAPWRAVRHQAARRQFVMENVVPGRKRIRFMESDAAHGGRNRKRHRDVIVERGVVSLWHRWQWKCVCSLRKVRKLSTTSEHIGQTSSQSMSNSPATQAWRKRSMASASAIDFSVANSIGLMR